MRFVGLLVLAFLLPIFANAAELININTADAARLITLPEIGPAYAKGIIDYRTANGPFVKIEDIQKVKGIGPVTYAKIAPLITVGTASAPPPPETPSTSTTTTTTSASNGAPPEYIPIPTLRISTGKDRTVSAGADTAFTAVVYDNKGNRRDEALIVWSFGDGMQRTGASVYHTYYYPGEYVAVVRVSTSDGGDAFVESVVTVKDANIKIVSVSARGISLINNSSRTLDLSLWRLSMSGKEFKIPTGTQILTGRTILFPSQIIQLPISDTASLLYPSGEVSAMYPQIQNEQPSAQQTSFNTVQTVEPPAVSKVEPIISTRANIQKNEKEVRAPATATELAAAGAALPTEQPKAGGLFKSPWFYSLLGVIVLAGAAFIFI